MTNRVDNYNPIPPVKPESKGLGDSSRLRKSATPDFKEILKEKIQGKGIKFSNHCLKRMEQNNITLTQVQMEKLNGAVLKAESKGARESLVIMDNMALVVSIKNKTVITAVDEKRMKDNVYTNIDSAVII